MHRIHSLAALFAAFCLVVVASIAAQTAQAQAPASFRLVRCTAGPKGSEVQGQFRLDEERTTFNRSKDRQIVVYFRWEGTPGLRRMGARWRSPGGTITTSSEFEYMAKERVFAAYWTFPLAEDVQLGDWAVEVSIDGQPAGTLAVHIVDDAAPAAVTMRRLLSPSEMYELLNGMFVQIERIGVSGRNAKAAGVMLAPGTIATSFAAVEGTDALRVIPPGGAVSEVTALAGWNRRYDWATLTSTIERPATSVAKLEEVKIGDRCFSMIGGVTGSRRITDCSIVGRTQVPGGGARLIATFAARDVALGAPVVNDFGELIGFVGGGLTPLAALDENLMADDREELSGVPVVPYDAVHAASTSRNTTLTELRKTGVLVAPATRREDIVSVALARAISKQSQNLVQPVDTRRQFSVADKNLWVVITWYPKERLRGMVQVRVYDDENRTIAGSTPVKADFKAGETRSSHWQTQIPAPGIYRVEVLIDEKTAWRDFFSVRR